MNLIQSAFKIERNYDDLTKEARARVVLTLSLGTSVLALLFGLITLGMSLAGVGLYTSFASQGNVLGPIIIVISLALFWLTRRGYLSVSALLVGVLLWGVTFAGLALGGITARAVLSLPVALAYSSLTYGTWGTIAGTLGASLSLVVTAYAQSEGWLRLESQPLDVLLYDAGVGVQLLIVTALLLWLFAWSLDRALHRASRTATQTRATAEAGQIISRILNMDELLTNTVDLIRDRFAFYHIQIFIVDDKHSYADLAASTGELGQALLAQGFRIQLGSRTVVSEVITTGELLYVADRNNTTYRLPDLLSSIRSELAIPLVVNDEIFGALNILSLRPNAFGPEDIEAMRVMANQVSQSIQNAQLFESQQQSLLQNRRLFLESETNLREIQRLNRQLTGQSWREYVIEHGTDQFSVQLDGKEMQTGAVDWTEAMEQAIERQRVVTDSQDESYIVAVPITIRGQPIGAIEVQLPSSRSQSEIRNVLQAVAERMAFSLENARLFEQAQMAAEREKQINAISSRMQGLTSIEDVLATAVSTLGASLGADQGAIRLITLDAGTPAAPPVNPSGNGHASQDRAR